MTLAFIFNISGNAWDGWLSRVLIRKKMPLSLHAPPTFNRFYFWMSAYLIIESTLQENIFYIISLWKGESNRLENDKHEWNTQFHSVWIGPWGFLYNKGATGYPPGLFSFKSLTRWQMNTRHAALGVIAHSARTLNTWSHRGVFQLWDVTFFFLGASF